MYSNFQGEGCNFFFAEYQLFVRVATKYPLSYLLLLNLHNMVGSWGKEQELNTINTGGIWYKKADIHEVSVNIIDNTAILLNRITLLAVVEGSEVTNPVEVTEVYVKQTAPGS
jgi:hypothetical protein